MAALAASRQSRFATVLLATDLTAVSAQATDRAIDLACQLDARLLVVNVIDPRRAGLLRQLGRVRPVEEREARESAAQEVVRLARQAGARSTFLVWDGDPGDGIVAAAEAESADLIVVGSRGRGTVGRLLGSVSDAVVRRATVPVLVVRPSPGPDEQESSTDFIRHEGLTEAGGAGAAASGPEIWRPLP